MAGEGGFAVSVPMKVERNETGCPVYGNSGFVAIMAGDSQLVPVRQNPRERTCIGTVRVRWRGSWLRSGAKISGCFSFMAVEMAILAGQDKKGRMGGSNSKHVPRPDGKYADECGKRPE
jgi:hypothetical protein